MSHVHRKRLYVIVSLIVGLGTFTGLVLFALSQNINLFYTPTELKATLVKSHKTIRVGGMVVKESFHQLQDLNVVFTITDFQENLQVQYNGILPTLFREGQGVVAQGHLNEQGQFVAKQVLAKHDEKYMPPELASGLAKTQPLATLAKSSMATKAP